MEWFLGILASVAGGYRLTGRLDESLETIGGRLLYPIEKIEGLIRQRTTDSYNIDEFTYGVKEGTYTITFRVVENGGPRGKNVCIRDISPPS